VSERALRKPDRIDCGQQRGCGGNRGLPGDAQDQPIDRQQSRGGDDQLGEPGGERREAGELPP
jgi:hypothetical protein